MNKLSPFLAFIFLASGAQAQLKVDFNSTTQEDGPNNQAGFQAFNAAHEGTTPPPTQNYSALGTSVAVTVSWPNTTDQNVRQFIDRAAANDRNWGSSNIDLLTDWAGADTRTAQGGKGTYNGNAGTPTDLVVTLGGLTPGNYEWTSYHHDTENMVGDFTVELSLNGGANYSQIGGTRTMTDSSTGGNPDGAQTYSDASFTIVTLPSTVAFPFTAASGQEIKVRFRALSTSLVHQSFMVVNGFEVAEVASTDGPTALSLLGSSVSSAATIGTTVGSFTTIDSTPGDTFSYSLVSGPGNTNNGDFDLQGDQLLVDRDISEFPAGTILSIRVSTTDASSNSFEQTFNIALVADSDGDGLDDAWELTYFPNLTTTSGTDQSDGDNLNNLAEQAAGTDPTLADTDGDTLNDDLETNTGTYQSPTDTGSNPLNSDSDGDGLNDGEEVSDTNGFVTNPNLADTDGDGFNDQNEISRGFDPTLSGNFPPGLLPLVLNEILTNNQSGLEDGNGKKSDWIEIFNPNSQTINLEGFYLTDDSTIPTKWIFPAINIGSNGYLVVFASGDNAPDADANLHTNFRLTNSGEYLALVSPNGNTIEDVFSPTYPEQFGDISYGRSSSGEFAFFTTSTPGQANNSGAPGVVKDTRFSVDRGFYDDPFALAILSDTQGAQIRYTLDGSLPTPTTGTIYTGPISISTTTNVRALATLPGTDWLPTNVDTHTYIFVDDVAQQPADPAGWASDWGSDAQVGQIVVSDYEMDPRVVNDTLNLRDADHSIRNALLDIPSVSITMKQLDIATSQADRNAGFSQSLYGTPRERFERICSVEYLLPDGSKGFQEDCKIETHGNSSRTPFRMQKHSLRLTFSSQVGAGKLNYDLFPDSTIDQFNKLVLRACFTDSWALNTWSVARYRPNDAQYLRDVWMKDSMKAMGHASGEGNFVHLYLNGLYFGLHNLTERIEDDWYAEHLGGETEDWLVNSDLSNPPARWNTMLSLANQASSSDTAYDSLKDYLDLENYADYMLLHFFADSEDWPHKNGYAAANVDSGDGKFRFQVWDQEIALDKFSWNRYDDNRSAGTPLQSLRQNDDFKILFADRVYRHLFDGGALTVLSASGRYLERANEIDKAIVAESARWGDVQASTPYGHTPLSQSGVDQDYHPPLINNPIYFTREQHWVVERDNIINHYLPVLHDQSDSRSFIRELRAEDLYPSIDPPNYSQLGGVVPQDFELSLTSQDGGVYYTTDGSDPRAPGGGIAATAGSFGAPSVASVFPYNSSDWLFLDTAVAQSTSDVVVGNGAYGATDWKHPSYDDSPWTAGQAPIGKGINTVTFNSDFNHGTSPFTPTIYFRKEFNVTGASDYVSLNFSSIQDDGIIVYLNGREIYRHNIDPGTIEFSHYANASDNEGTVIGIEHTLAAGQIQEGVNIIAVELHNRSAGSSDMGLEMKLDALKAAEAGNSFNLTETSSVKSRTRASNGEWSALREANFIVGTPANSQNLIISEIMFNPAGPDENLEFIELFNISATEALDLTNVSFTDGITYTFPTGFVIPPGGRVVVVKNQATFAANYTTNGIVIAPGEFSSSLSNDGEDIVLTANDGSPIKAFRYFTDGTPSWPSSADGFGPSMVLIDPLSNPDPAVGSNWKSSTNNGGSPGTGEEKSLPANPAEDLDGDGFNALAEYFFGTSDTEAGANPMNIQVINDEIIFSYPFDPAATAAQAIIELSDDLNSWAEEPASITNQANGSTPDGRMIENLKIDESSLKKFIRVRVIQTP
ncbi:lamin tail domain-containing protein [Akkermansiaceae bacterium]|nr:lamin tail domain-containing protein [Akkermansiaceae bacterium]